MNRPSTTEQAHIVACSYKSAQAAKVAWNNIQPLIDARSGVTNCALPTGGDMQYVVAVVADCEEAAIYSQLLPWGVGSPITLDEGTVSALAQHRESGKKKAAKLNGSYIKRNQLSLTLTDNNAGPTGVVQLSAVSFDGVDD